MFGRFALILVMFLITFPVTAQDKVLERIVKNGEINCGVYALGSIFSYDAQNKPTGFTVDLMDEVATRTGLKVKYTEIASFATLRQDMEGGKFDMICAPTLFFPSTTMKFLPSLYIAHDIIEVYADGKSDIAPVKKVGELNDPRYTFVGMDGELGGLYAPTLFPKAKLAMLPQGSSPGQMLLEVQTKKADFVLLTRIAALAILKDSPEKIKRVAVLSDRRPSVRLFYLADSYQLKANIDATLEEIQKEGILERLLKKHNLLF